MFSPAGLRETTEQLVKKKLEGKDKLTPWEEFLEKKKDRKKQKKLQRNQVSRKVKQVCLSFWILDTNFRIKFGVFLNICVIFASS